MSSEALEAENACIAEKDVLLRGGAAIYWPVNFTLAIALTFSDDLLRSFLRCHLASPSSQTASTTRF